MRWLLVLLVGCGGKDGDPSDTSAPPAGDPSTTSTTSPSTSSPTTPDTTPPTTAPKRIRMMLHGGGTEDEVLYTRFVEAAGYGHIVTLGAREDDDPYLYWFDSWWPTLGAASAETVNALTPSHSSARNVFRMPSVGSRKASS